MRVEENQHKSSIFVDEVSERDISEPVDFHQYIPGYAPTPLGEMTDLAQELGLNNIYIKDEGFRFGLKAFKALGASFAVYNYLRKLSDTSLSAEDFLEDKGRALAEGITFTTATDGNHGRAVAWIARLLGSRAVIFMPEESVEARVEAIRAEGARVRLIAGGYDRAVEAAALEGERPGRVVISDTGYAGYMEIPEFIQRGYYTLFHEITLKLNEEHKPPPDILVLQAGVGAFAAAGIRYAKTIWPDTEIWIVEPNSANCLQESAMLGDGEPVSIPAHGDTIMAGLNCGTPSLTAWKMIKDNADLFISIEDEWTRKAMRYFADYGNIVSGESGGSGFAALLAVADEMPDMLYYSTSKKKKIALIINTEADTDPGIYQEIVGKTASEIRKAIKISK